MTEEQKEKYANFLDKVSEILGLNKPVDILRLCAVTDEYFKPIEKRMTELEKENAELKIELVEGWKKDYLKKVRQLTKAKEIIKEYLRINLQAPIDRKFDEEVSLFKQAEQFLTEADF